MKIRQLGLIGLIVVSSGLVAADRGERRTLLSAYAQECKTLMQRVCTAENGKRAGFVVLGAGVVAVAWVVTGTCGEMATACDGAREALSSCTGQIGRLVNLTTPVICQLYPKSCP